jgi:predicted metal-binding membrane protein
MTTLSRQAVSDIYFWVVFYGLIALSWLTLLVMAIDEFSSISTLIDAICVSTTEATVWELMAMWGLMMLAMMLPTFRAHARVHQDIHCKHQWPSHTLLLVLGFLLIWSIFVPMGAFAQTLLLNGGLVDPSGRTTSLVGNGLILLLAGAYQFSKLKRACMNQCASPMHYFFKYWRDHHLGALQMGMHLGALCVGCCWALMALAFVGGTMNIVWMAALTGLMIFDKQQYFHQQFSQSVGWTLIFAGGLILLIAFILEVTV